MSEIAAKTVIPEAAKPNAGNPAAAQLAAAQQARFAKDFSQVVAVLMRDTQYKNLRVADLEWLVLPPLIAGQSRVAMARHGTSGPIIPVAAALWARVSDAVDKRLSGNLDKPPLLRANEWTSGDNIWLITLAGSKQALPSLIMDLQKSVLKGRAAKVRTQKKDGTPYVQIIGAAKEAASS